MALCVDISNNDNLQVNYIDPSMCTSHLVLSSSEYQQFQAITQAPTTELSALTYTEAGQLLGATALLFVTVFTLRVLLQQLGYRQ